MLVQIYPCTYILLVVYRKRKIAGCAPQYKCWVALFQEARRPRLTFLHYSLKSTASAGCCSPFTCCAAVEMGAFRSHKLPFDCYLGQTFSLCDAHSCVCNLPPALSLKLYTRARSQLLPNLWLR